MIGIKHWQAVFRSLDVSSPIAEHNPEWIQVNGDGSIGPLQDHENFPDFPSARVLGTKSATLPDLLTS